MGVEERLLAGVAVEGCCAQGRSFVKRAISWWMHGPCSDVDTGWCG